MTLTENVVERGIELFRSLVAERSELVAELAASAREYFRGMPPPAEDSREANLAARRHFEWFLCERDSQSLGGVPVQGLAERWYECAKPEEVDAIDAILGSHASLFEVTGIEPGQGVWLRDLASSGEHPVQDPEGSRVLETGDLVVGRVFPVGDSLFHVSRAAGVFRSPDLLRAVHRDLERARSGRRGVLRLLQSELEAMFWHGSGPAADAVTEARTFLARAGLEDTDIDQVLLDFENDPLSAGRVAPGARDRLGEVLDQLAFETSVDLDEARQILLRAWQALSRNAHVEDPAAHEAGAGEAEKSRVERAIAAFDRGRENGKDLERLFDELEHDLGLDETDDEAEEDFRTPDFPGVVAAMVEEFLWETEREDGKGVRRDLEVLGALGRFGTHIGVFENLCARDLVVFCARWLPESGELEGAEDARRMLGALRRFARWAEERHALTDLFAGFSASFDALCASLPRIAEASRRRTREARGTHGELFEIVALENRTEGVARDRKGEERAVVLDALIGEWLRPGDLVRGNRLADGRLAIYACYPPQARDAGARPGNAGAE